MPAIPDDPTRILIMRSDNSLSLTVLLGSTPAKMTDGIGGWQLQQRPHRTPLTVYQGRNPFQMEISLMFDGWTNRVSQEHDIRRLIYMAMPPKGERQPLPVLVYGALPFPSGGLWVINGLAPGDNVYWGKIQGVLCRLRQDYTLTLLQYIRPDLTEFTDPGEGLAPKVPALHRVVKGDTLRKLAQFYYGDYTRWKDIAAVNALPDPQNLVPGTNLRIPK